jgi:hypothetical protein
MQSCCGFVPWHISGIPFAGAMEIGVAHPKTTSRTGALSLDLAVTRPEQGR